MKKITDFMSVSAMGPPGGNKSKLSMRLLRYFYTHLSKNYDETTLCVIFKTIVNWFCAKKNLSEDAKRVLHFCVEGSVDLFNKVTIGLKATPTNSHYLFNLRDLSRTFQGLSIVDRQQFSHQKKTCRAWIHETWRTFGDRIINQNDRKWLYQEILHTTSSKVRDEFESIMRDMNKNFQIKMDPSDIEQIHLTDIMSDSIEIDEREYLEEINTEKVQERCLEYLEEMNLNSKTPFNICLFKYATEQIMKICRVLRMNRGNAVLLGLGGSGRQTLTFLSIHIMGQEKVNLEISKGYTQEK